ncbi:MAG: type II toxin-antitoxin system HicA family toxin [Bacteroidaceae bacterium]|nr:type II toxin-antitoxin system HicA family toxin [Bacteroidaceae bacterium]
MNTYKLSNISLTEFRQFLSDMGCREVECSDGGHEKWAKEGCLRPVILQTHISPVPEFILKNNLRTLGLTRKDFINWLKKQNKK